jgi:hypothetical protein
MAELPPGGWQIMAEVARIASTPGRIDQRAEWLLEPLHRVVPFHGAWISLLDPEAREQPPLVCHGYPDGLRRYMSGPAGVAELETLGTTRTAEATRLRDLSVPLEEVHSWTEYLAPAGFRGGLTAPLFTPDGRYLGVLGLHTHTETHPTVAARDLITRLAPTIAYAVDPMRSIATTVRIIHDAQAAIVLTRAGNTLPLPGLPTHRLLSPGSDVLTIAAERLTDGERHATFLCRRMAGGAADGHLRVTTLACPYQSPHHLAAVVAVSPPGDLRGLTWRELEILGLLVEDWPDRRIATARHLPPRNVAEAVERIQAKLGVPTRIMATLCAFRLGLYVPRSLHLDGR